MRVGADEIEVELVGVSFGQEIAATGEVFDVEELVFFEAMYSLDVALIGVSRGRDTDVLAVAESFGEVAFKLAAIVGLPDQIAERDAVAIQMLLDTGGKDGAGRSAASFGEGPEQQATADIAGRVLDHRKFQPLCLRPVARDVVKVFGVGADLLKQGPAGFDVCQVLFSLVFAAALLDQAVHAPDAAQGAVADGEVELADQAASAEGGQSLAQLDQLGFGSRRSFVRLMVTSARLPDEAGRAVLLEAAQPLADGGHSGGKESRRGFDAPLLGAFDQPQAMIVGVWFHFTNQIEVTGRHGPGILTAKVRRLERLWKSRCVENQKRVSHPAWESRPTRGIPTFPQPRRRRSSLRPSQQQFHFPPPLLAQAFQTPQGDTM